MRKIEITEQQALEIICVLSARDIRNDLVNRLAGKLYDAFEPGFVAQDVKELPQAAATPDFVAHNKAILNTVSLREKLGLPPDADWGQAKKAVDELIDSNKQLRLDRDQCWDRVLKALELPPGSGFAHVEGRIAALREIEARGDYAWNKAVSALGMLPGSGLAQVERRIAELREPKTVDEVALIKASKYDALFSIAVAALPDSEAMERIRSVMSKND